MKDLVLHRQGSRALNGQEVNSRARAHMTLMMHNIEKLAHHGYGR